jgi:hypothetical protein
LTTTGTSGAATLVGSTLNIPQYQSVITNPITGTGTPNYVSKFTSPGSIGDSLIFDNGTNVGIGTTLPGYKLTVEGYIGAERFYPYNTNSTYISGDGSGMMIQGSGYLYVPASGGSYFLNQVRFRSTIENDTNAYLQINGGTSGITYINGSIGIGTTSPSAKLHIMTDAIYAGIFNTTTITASSTAISIGGYTTGVGGAGGSSTIRSYHNHGSTTATSLAFEVNGTSEAMRITSSGNVGIGNTSPITKLTLNSYTGSRLPYIQNTAYSIDAGGITIGSSTTTGNKAGGIDLTNNTYGVGYYSPIMTFSSLSSNSVYNNAYAGIWGVVAGQGSDANWVKGDLAFGTAVSYGIEERMRISSNGFVGIGTTSPAGALHVATFGQYSYFSGNSGGSSIADVQGLAIGWNKSSGGGETILAFNKGGGATGGLAFSCNDGGSYAEYMRVTSNGNVGIGTTSPSTKLEVTGNIKASLSGYELQMYPAWDTGVAGFGTSSNHGLVLSTNNTERMRITSGGNVGIGTTTPSNKLTVNGNIETTGSGKIGFNVNDSYGNFPHYGLGYAGGDNYTNLAGYFGLSFGTTGNERMRITTTGNVGINTTNPQKPLEVYSNANDFVSVGVNQMAVGQWSGIHFGYREANSAYRKSAIVFERTDLTANDAQGKIHILNGPQNSAGSATLSDAKLTIAENGYVGIGTTSPGSKLDVVGIGIFRDRLIVSADAGNEQFVIQRASNTNSQLILGYHSSGYARIQAVQQGVGYTPLALNQDGGNVGISTASPTEKLDVRGVIRVSNNGVNDSGIIAFGNYLNGPGYYDNGIFRGAVNNINTAGNYLNIGSYDGLVFTTSNAALGSQAIRMFINGANGNVGIGTTNPNYKLDVNGDVYFGGNIDIGANGINFYGASSVLVNRVAPRLDFYGSPSNLSMSITTAGNVGIGTTSPGYKLDVSGKIRASSGITNESDHSNTRFENILPAALNGGGTGIVQMSWWVSEPNISWDAAGFGYNVTNNGTGTYGFGRINNSFGQAYMRFFSSGHLQFYNADTAGNRVETMFLRSDGNVGIGTTNAIYKLTLEGEMAIFNSSRIIFGQNQGGGASINYNSNGNLDITPRSGYNTIFTSGNVGIGTTSPITILHANSSSNTTAGLFIQNQSTNVVTIGNEATWLGTGSSNNAVVAAFGSNSLLFGTNATEKMRITDSGYVGIGQSNPQSLLHLKQSSSNFFRMSRGSASNYGFELGVSNDFYIYDYNNSRSALTILNSGSVGVGTNTPDPSAILELTSTTQGFLPPRMDNSEINAISNPAEGLIVYSTQSKCLFLFDGANWQKIAYA